MIKKSQIILCYLITILILTDSLFATFRRGLGKIRKRKRLGVKETNRVMESENEDSLAMYYTRRTTPWPRMEVTLNPNIEAYYNKRNMKEHLIKQVYFKKAKMKKNEKTHKKTAIGDDLSKVPALD